MRKWLRVLVAAAVGTVVIGLLDTLTGFQRNPVVAQLLHDVPLIVLGGVFWTISSTE